MNPRQGRHFERGTLRPPQEHNGSRDVPVMQFETWLLESCCSSSRVFRPLPARSRRLQLQPLGLAQRRQPHQQRYGFGVLRRKRVQSAFRRIR